MLALSCIYFAFSVSEKRRRNRHSSQMSGLACTMIYLHRFENILLYQNCKLKQNLQCALFICEQLSLMENNVNVCLKYIEICVQICYISLLKLNSLYWTNTVKFLINRFRKANVS